MMMTQNIKVLLLAVFVLLHLQGFAEVKPISGQSTILNGTVDSSFSAKEIMIGIYTLPFRYQTDPDQLYTLKLINNQFQLNLPVKKNRYFISFWLQHGYIRQHYIIEPGDSIFISISKEHTGY